MVDRGRDDVTLSERERQTLKEIEAQLLSSGPRWSGGGRGLAAAARLPGWVAVVLLVVGSGIMLVSFTASLPVAVIGALICAAGIGLSCVLFIPRTVGWFKNQSSPSG